MHGRFFLGSEFQIKGQGIFDFNYYKSLKNDRFLDYFYLSLSIQERKFKSKLEQLENAKVNGLREINERKGTLDAELQDFDKNIIKNRNETNELASLLENQKTAFNFVGLSKGFENILKKKTCAKWTSFVLLFLITLSMFTIWGIIIILYLTSLQKSLTSGSFQCLILVLNLFYFIYLGWFLNTIIQFKHKLCK